jgi:6-phosphogluconate dehydrogenase
MDSRVTANALGRKVHVTANAVKDHVMAIEKVIAVLVMVTAGKAIAALVTEIAKASSSG